MPGSHSLPTGLNNLEYPLLVCGPPAPAEDTIALLERLAAAGYAIVPANEFPPRIAFTRRGLRAVMIGIRSAESTLKLLQARENMIAKKDRVLAKLLMVGNTPAFFLSPASNKALGESVLLTDGERAPRLDDPRISEVMIKALLNNKTYTQALEAFFPQLHPLQKETRESDERRPGQKRNRPDAASGRDQAGA
ncbi:hypothetical protein MNEG_14214 [Monoraphidium neglectum]|uniref:Uncharacterized protein n=1 Tax=Monoraphidium neglectum TaxID=145388 RepID=A0A0D2KD81_9CHLO|nr:hypothetical protein MNEG_14214 [Monoraphidium neglectum]KIY93748.1 hypothetical protein MNEG_14214 [Monoraphidium neglectum]|eukprot:XP_013892768.1 hypothetical protein MNEG_14214 [Monoraphidium neglectum]